jgi:hypothetical protein
MGVRIEAIGRGDENKNVAGSIWLAQLGSAGPIEELDRFNLVRLAGSIKKLNRFSNELNGPIQTGLTGRSNQKLINFYYLINFTQMTKFGN